MQLTSDLSEAETSSREQLQECESRFAQTISELREAADEANQAAETASQNVEHWRRRWFPEILEMFRAAL